MAEIKYEHNKVIQLTGEEDVITGYTPNYAVVINNTGDTVYLSKESGILSKIETNDVKAVPSGMIDYIAGEQGRKYRFFALGNGSVEIIEAWSLGECLEIIAGYYAGRRAAKISNPNLLVNPDFSVNQRAGTSYSTGGYTVDCWKLFSTVSGSLGSVTVSDDGVTLTGGDNAMDAYLCQFLEDSYGNKFAGKTVTVSFEVENVTGLGICVAQYGRSESSNLFARVTSDGTYTVTGVWEPLSITNRHALMFYNRGASSSAKIKWIKLELGEVSTPFCPPDPATELVKCQRFYQIHTTGNVSDIDIRPIMRVAPLITKISDTSYSYSAEL